MTTPDLKKLAEVKRITLIAEYGMILSEENENGAWVRHSDHLAAVTTLLQEVETLRGQIARAYRQHPQPRHGTGEQMTRPDHCPTCGAFPVDIPAPPTDALVEALSLILPMAKGYAAAHPVGSNAEYIRIAEEALPKDGQTPQSGKKEDGWLPIETAPTDGTDVILWVAPWKTGAEGRYIEDEGWYLANVHPTDAHGEQIYPTHWMPLPSPPASKAEGET